MLPDVPAVYFISPTDANIKVICDDFSKVRQKKSLSVLDLQFQ